MNEKFYELSTEKQHRIKHAGYKTFGENTYKKASMKQLADEAGISKALVFHYFKNKMTLYKWLFNEVLKELNAMESVDLSSSRDFFEMIYEVSTNRLEMMEEYQVMYSFIIRVFNDSMDEGHESVYQHILTLTERRKQMVLAKIDMNRFKSSLDVPMLYDLINDLANGYYQRIGNLNYDEQKSMTQFFSYLDSLKRHYYKEEYH